MNNAAVILRIMVLKKFFTFLLIINSLIFADLQIGLDKKKPVNIKTIYFGETPYYSVNFLANHYKIRIYNKKSTGKFVFYFPNIKIKVTANSSFVMLNQEMIHMISPAIQAGNEIYVPVHSFNDILQKYVYKKLKYTLVTDDEKLIFAVPADKSSLGTGEVKSNVPVGKTSISDIKYKETKNGLAIIFSTNGNFIKSDFSSFFNNKNDFYFTIFGCHADSNYFATNTPTKSIKFTKVITSNNSTQFLFRFKKDFHSSDVYFNPQSNQVILSLFLPLNEEIKEKISNIKETLKIDTIVLDAGHGGKDGGTPGRWGNKHEKFIALDVVLRLGKLIEKQTNINVVYTRKTDVFVPLWKRTKIANDANGKLFISVHVNGVKNKKANGFETYLLRPGRSADAIKVAEKENAVIQMENADDKLKYENYDNIANILANLVHSTNMKDSESFAEILSKNVTKNVPQRNRGVKQAGFYILVGASMPKVLIELGFNSNYKEAKKLNKRRHRQILSENIFNSIMEFKIKSDNTIE